MGPIVCSSMALIFFGLCRGNVFDKFVVPALPHYSVTLGGSTAYFLGKGERDAEDFQASRPGIKAVPLKNEWSSPPEPDDRSRSSAARKIAFYCGRIWLVSNHFWASPFVVRISFLEILERDIFNEGVSRLSNPGIILSKLRQTRTRLP